MKHTASVLVSSAFIRSGLIDSAAKLVYLTIASRTNASNLAIVPLREITQMSNMSINTVRHAIHTLQSHGYIVVHRCTGQSHIYQLCTRKQKKCIAIPTSLIYNRIMSTTSKIVYAILLSFNAYSQSKCCPSMRTIATHIGASVRTVQRAIATLRGCNAITTVCVATHNGAYPHNEYTLHGIDDTTEPARSEHEQYDSKLCTYCAAAEENEPKKTCVEIGDSNTGKPIKDITNHISEMYCTTDTQQSQSKIAINDLKIQISYDWLVAQHNGVSADIDNCLQAIIDGLRICANKPIVISGHQYDYAAYVSAVRQLTADHIQLAIERWRLKARSTRIGNPLAYLRSVVINTLSDIDLYYASRVEFDTYN